MAQKNGWTPVTGVQCQRNGAMNADGSSSLVIPSMAILAASDPTEGTEVTSATTRVQHGINERWANMSGQRPHGGAMDGGSRAHQNNDSVHQTQNQKDGKNVGYTAGTMKVFATS